MPYQNEDFLDDDGKWQCISCGICCWFVGMAYPEMEAWPGGPCKHLKDNQCEIYEDRPEVCRVKTEMGDDVCAAACRVVTEVAVETARSADGTLLKRYPTPQDCERPPSKDAQP